MKYVKLNRILTDLSTAEIAIDVLENLIIIAFGLADALENLIMESFGCLISFKQFLSCGN